MKTRVNWESVGVAVGIILFWALTIRVAVAIF